MPLAGSTRRRKLVVKEYPRRSTTIKKDSKFESGMECIAARLNLCLLWELELVGYDSSRLILCISLN